MHIVTGWRHQGNKNVMQPAMRQPDASYYVQQHATINWLPPEWDLNICLNNICYSTHKNRRVFQRDGASWQPNIQETRLNCEVSHTKDYSRLVLNCSSDKLHALHSSLKKKLHYTQLAQDAKEHKTENRRQTRCGGRRWSPFGGVRRFFPPPSARAKSCFSTVSYPIMTLHTANFTFMHPWTSHFSCGNSKVATAIVCNLDPNYAPEGCRVSGITPSGYSVRGWRGQLLWLPSGVPSPHRCADITQLFSYVTTVTLTGCRNTQLTASDRRRPPGGGYVQ
jgi:hypothetical protein